MPEIGGPRYSTPTSCSMVASCSGHSVNMAAFTATLCPYTCVSWGATSLIPGARCRTTTFPSSHGSRTHPSITAKNQCFILPNRAGTIRAIGICCHIESYANGTSTLLSVLRLRNVISRALRDLRSIHRERQVLSPTVFIRHMHPVGSAASDTLLTIINLDQTQPERTSPSFQPMDSMFYTNWHLSSD
jgi:hypothetical protein